MNKTLKTIIGVIVVGCVLVLGSKAVKERFANVDDLDCSRARDHPKAFPDNNYLQNNKIQYDFVKLLSNFKDLSNSNDYKKLHPLVSSNIYTYTNITQLVRQELDQVIKPVIAQLNCKVKGEYFYSITEYKNAQVNEDRDGNKQYIVDTFLTDIKTHTGLRVRIDVIKYTAIRKGTPAYREWMKDKEGPLAKALAMVRKCDEGGDKSKEALKSCASVTTPGFDSFYIGYPAHEQLIPLPTEVITTGRVVLSGEGIHTNAPTPIKKLHLNYIHLINSDNVVDAFNTDDLSKDIEGMEKQRGDSYIKSRDPLEFSEYTRTDKNPNQETAYESNKWPKLKCQPTDRSGWPGTTVPFVWDDLGISPEVKPTKEKPGLTHACRPFPRTGQYWRNNLIVPKWSGNYQWLFSLTSGVNDRHVPV